MNSDSDALLRAAIKSICQLSSESLGKIDAHMRQTENDFAQAALAIGLATQQDIDDAQSLAGRGQSGPTPSFIEAAIRKSSPRNQVMVREGSSVSPGKRIRLLSDVYNPYCEQVKALRTEVLLRFETSSSGFILSIVSPSSGDGRSQLAAELSIAFAQLGQRTLLVDADMRKPTQHLLFECDNANGLSDSLTSNEPPLLHRVHGVPEMFFLNAGPVPSNPLELLSAGHFDKLARRWRQTYNFVVIDTPAIGHFTDALAVTSIAQNAIIVSRANHTPFLAAREMMRRLKTTQAYLLGSVLCRF